MPFGLHACYTGHSPDGLNTGMTGRPPPPLNVYALVQNSRPSERQKPAPTIQELSRRRGPRPREEQQQGEEERRKMQRVDMKTGVCAMAPWSKVGFSKMSTILSVIIVTCWFKVSPYRQGR
jgi:hypothetical protein